MQMHQKQAKKMMLQKLRGSSVIVAIVCCLVLFYLQNVNGLTYTLDPAEERCLLETLDQPAKLSLKFQVIKGGFLDIDLV